MLKSECLNITPLRGGLLKSECLNITPLHGGLLKSECLNITLLHGGLLKSECPHITPLHGGFHQRRAVDVSTNSQLEGTPFVDYLRLFTLYLGTFSQHLEAVYYIGIPRTCHTVVTNSHSTRHHFSEN
jgi:hypothetical protein